MQPIQINSKPFRASVNTPDGGQSVKTLFFHIPLSHLWLLLCSWRSTNRETTTHYQSTYTPTATQLTITILSSDPPNVQTQNHSSFFASFSHIYAHTHEVNTHTNTHIQYLCVGNKQPLMWAHTHTMPIHKSDDN